MSEIHHKIVREIIEEYQVKKDVIGIVVFGSVASGRERPDSDVDIEIIYNSKKKWELLDKTRYGIKIDFEEAGIEEWEKMTEKYPYLYYFEHDKIVYDSTGLLKKVFDKLKKYYKNNEKVQEFWRKEWKEAKKLKESGKKKEVIHFADICDKAEIKFSSHKKVKRKIMTKEWFNKHSK
ncbi:nucleotidyltransferase domain-containing protein [archaeon]|nr:nucleotidyltransferase domain-containing protein [archaeon]MBT7128884.1 nucleotidyltransferase domain-containing protein [archaeon]